ncbi:MAG: hypothetical protein GY703_02005, partial [Gammaproteobacteria bacterium]|nr:hypothetical protein [Gammaproteobacteria bacterium]
MVRFTHHFRHYLLGRPFRVRTDHHSLQWLLNFRHIEGQLARWLEVLGRYNMTIEHRPGKEHENADALSRYPSSTPCLGYRAHVDLASLPCGGCSSCQKQQRNWGQFEEEVDNVQELSNAETLRCQRVDCTSDLQMTGMDIQVPAICPAQPAAAPVPNLIVAPSDESMQQEQAKDPDLKMLLRWLETSQEPTQGEMMLASAASKHYVNDRTNFYLHQGTLYK